MTDAIDYRQFGSVRMGRPKKGLTKYEGHRDLKWFGPYREKLRRALATLDPVGLLTQGVIRDQWLHCWNQVGTAWNDHPDLYPQFPWFARRDAKGELPSEEGRTYLRRLQNMLQSEAIIRLDRLEHYGFHVLEFEEIYFFYDHALSIHSGAAKRARRILGHDRWPDFSHYHRFEVRKDLTRDEQIAEIARLIQENVTDNTLAPDQANLNLSRLRSYGVIEFIDLSFFELIHGKECDPDLKAKLVLPPKSGAPSGELNATRRGRDDGALRTTRAHALAFFRATHHFSGLWVRALKTVLASWRGQPTQSSPFILKPQDVEKLREDIRNVGSVSSEDYRLPPGWLD